jgi:hypothetical protein
MKTISVILNLICVALAFQPASAPAEPAGTRPWHAWGDPDAPASRPTGEPFLVKFINRQHKPVKIYWLSPAGERKYYYEIPSGGSRPQNVRKDAVWIVTDGSNAPLGYFLFEGPIAQAVVPRP